MPTPTTEIDRPPRAVFAAEREVAAGNPAHARAMIAEALSADPDNLWLHDAYQGRAGDAPEELARLEAQYRAFLAQEPRSPQRQLLLAFALIHAHGDSSIPGPLAEAQALIEGVREVRELSPWPLIAAARLAQARADQVGYRRAIESAWAEAPGHPAIAVSALYLAAGEDDRRVAMLAAVSAKREPRWADKVIDFLTPDPANPMPQADRAYTQLIQDLDRQARKNPRDLDLQFAMYRCYDSRNDVAKLSQVTARIHALDPTWQPKMLASELVGYRIPSGEKNLADQISAASTAQPELAVKALEALRTQTAHHPWSERYLNEKLAWLYSRPPLSNPAKALEARRRVLDLLPDDSDAVAYFARAAAEAGSDLDEAQRLADGAVKGALAGRQSDHEPRSYLGDWWHDEAARVSTAAYAAGLVKTKQGDAAGARRDLLLAALLRANGPVYLRLAEVEERLGHADEAFEARIAAAALGELEPSDDDANHKALAKAASGRYLWLDVEGLIAAEKKRRASTGGPEEPVHPLLGKPAPEFAAPLLGGDKVALSSLRGKVVVVDFWATWCGPCREALPALDALAKKLGGSAVAFVTLSTDSSDDWSKRVPGFVKDRGLALPVAWADEATQSAFAVGGIPSLFVIDKEGVIRHHHLGYSNDLETSLAKEIEALK